MPPANILFLPTFTHGTHSSSAIIGAQIAVDSPWFFSREKFEPLILLWWSRSTLVSVVRNNPRLVKIKIERIVIAISVAPLLAAAGEPRAYWFPA